MAPCANCGVDKGEGMKRCPSCLKIGKLSEKSYYCSQECFTLSWEEHKVQHRDFSSLVLSPALWKEASAVINAHLCTQEQISSWLPSLLTWLSTAVQSFPEEDSQQPAFLEAVVQAKWNESKPHLPTIAVLTYTLACLTEGQRRLDLFLKVEEQFVDLISGGHGCSFVAIIRCQIGFMYLGLHQHDQAIKYFFLSKGVLQPLVSPTDLRLQAVHFGLGRAFFETVDYEKAKEYLSLTLSNESERFTTNSNYNSARFCLLWINFLEDRHDDTPQGMDTMLSLFADQQWVSRANVMCLRGLMLLNEGRCDAACEDFNEVIQSEVMQLTTSHSPPHHIFDVLPMAHYGVGVACLKLNQRQQAVKMFGVCAADVRPMYAPKRFMFYFCESVTHYILGDFVRATEAMRCALRHSKPVWPKSGMPSYRPPTQVLSAARQLYLGFRKYCALRAVGQDPPSPEISAATCSEMLLKFTNL